MGKRILAAILWFYVGWYAWAMIAELFGVTELFGPVFGAALAALIAGDPRHIIWKRPATTPVAAPAPEAVPEAV
jgi:hypothetical protein